MKFFFGLINVILLFPTKNYLASHVYPYYRKLLLLYQFFMDYPGFSNFLKFLFGQNLPTSLPHLNPRCSPLLLKAIIIISVFFRITRIFQSQPTKNRLDLDFADQNTQNKIISKILTVYAR